MGSQTTDEIRTRIGIRTFSLGKRLLINGEEFHICGSNRHQEYPYIEYALSPNCAFRDAKKIKDGGFNFIRMSHYPQDPAFIEACDELGVLLQAPTPGWQHFSFNDSFVRQTFQDIRDLLRRDRNHPSVVFWEPNLNETDTRHQDWQRAAHEIAHAELPGDQCFTFGDPYPEKKGWDWDVQGLLGSTATSPSAATKALRGTCGARGTRRCSSKPGTISGASTTCRGISRIPMPRIPAVPRG